MMEYHSIDHIPHYVSVPAEIDLFIFRPNTVIQFEAFIVPGRLFAQRSTFFLYYTLHAGANTFIAI